MKRSLLDELPQQRSRRAVLVAAVATCGVHIGLAVLALVLGARVVSGAPPPAVTDFIELEAPAKPEPTTPERVAEPPPEPKTVPPVAAPRPATPATEAPPPALAKVGQVLAASDDVVDFGDRFDSGRATASAGGVSQASGTSDRAVQKMTARSGGIAGSSGKGPVVDRSRPPTLAGGFAWDCPFPVETEGAGIDQAVVGLRVEVGRQGEVRRVTVTSDPGDGFGRVARRCAASKRWTPGLDRDGAPVESVAVVRVRFQR